MENRSPRLLIAGLLLWLVVAVPGHAAALELPVPVAGDGMVRVDQAVVRGLLEAYLETRGEVLPSARLVFKSIEPVRPFILPAGGATCEVVPADPAIIGSRRFSLIFRAAGRVQANLALRTELEALAPVVVTAGDLPRGAILAQKDLALVEMDITGIRESPYRETDALIGKSLRRAMKKGEVVQKGLLAVPPVVRRGELVTMTVRSGGLVLSASGAACDNGGIGETIRVRNNSSQKEVSGRVVAPGKVDVEM